MDMDFDRKKILIIISGIGVVIFGLAGIYFIFFGTNRQELVSNQANEVQQQVETGGGLPTIGPANENTGQVQPTETTTVNEEAQKPVLVVGQQIKAELAVDNLTSNISVGNDGVRYYEPDTGTFYKRLSNGNVVSMSDRQFNNIEKVTWAKTDKAVIEFPDGANVVYDFVKQKQYTLPSQLKEFAFNNSSDRLMAKVTGPLFEDNWLVAINSDGSNFAYIESMGKNSDKVQPLWSPNGMVGAIFADGNGADSNTIVPIGLHGENYPSFNTLGRGFKGVWSEDGKKMLYTTYSSQVDFRTVLWLAEFNDDLTVKRQINLGVNTFLNKCTLSGNKAYCAVPQNMPEASGWFPELTNNISDDLYVIDLDNNTVKRMATPIINGVSFTIDSIQVDKITNQLIVSEAGTGKIYTINLNNN